MKLKLALAQINTKLGNIQANLEKHLALAKQAHLEGTDLLIFPELSLTGYVLQDLVSTVSCRPDSTDPVFQPLLEASRDIDLMVGRNDLEKSGSRLGELGYSAKTKVRDIAA